MFLKRSILQLKIGFTIEIGNNRIQDKNLIRRFDQLVDPTCTSDIANMSNFIMITMQWSTSMKCEVSFNVYKEYNYKYNRKEKRKAC